MPAIGDLDRVWERVLSGQNVTAAPIPSDNGNLRLARKPGLGCRRLAIRQEGDGLVALEIGDERPIPMITPPGPVVGPDNCRRMSGVA
jgi:hypothetical protein